MEKILENYNLLKLKKEEAERLNRPIIAAEIKAVIKKLPTHRNPGLDDFTEEFYKTFKVDLTPIFLRLFQNNPKRGKTSKLVI